MTVHRRRKLFIRIIVSILAVIIAAAAFGEDTVFASKTTGYTVNVDEDDLIICTNSEGSYRILIDDSADLFTYSEMKELVSYMMECTDNGNAYLVTINRNNYGSAQRYADAYYDKLSEGQSGILFLIDMDTRQLYFSTTGAYRRSISNSKADIIADNIYKMASGGNYFRCAKEAFIEIAAVLDGERIAAPMKYISNACLAILIALLINYFIARSVSKSFAPSNVEIARHLISSFSFTNPSVVHTNTTRTYSPRSSGSGGGGGGGGGHGGGGHSF